MFLTNNFALPALTITQLYRLRWQVELFFKWIKQHLRIKAFFGTSENAVKSQIWIAVSVYVLVAIVKKRLALREPVRNPTNPEPDHVRANPVESAAYPVGIGAHDRHLGQSAEFVRVTLGHY